MTSFRFHSAARPDSALRRGKLRSVELLDLVLGRMQWLNPRINAIVPTDVTAARKRAHAADAAHTRGDILGPLHGLPRTAIHRPSFSPRGE